MSHNVTVAFAEALDSSAYGWRRDLSTPSLPGVGINDSFEKSDQKHFIMKCPHCGNYFTLLDHFPRNVVELSKDRNGTPNHGLHLSHNFIRETDTHAYICLKCNNFISDETRVLGAWHPFFKHKTAVSGYQISQLMCPWVSASALMKKKTDYNLDQLFTNYVLGLPYLGDNIMLTDADIMRCIDTSIKNPYEFKRDKVVIGGDWGNGSWGVSAMNMPDGSERILLLDIWYIDDTMAEVQKDGRKDNPHIKITADKMRQWDCKMGVFDAGYGKDKNWELMQLFPKRVHSCFYPNLSQDITKTVNDSWHENDDKVNVDRTTTLKVATKLFRDGKVIIPEWVAINPLFKTFKKHLTNLVIIRDIDEDEKTHKEVISERIGTLSGGDHLGHAWNYCTIGLRNTTKHSGKGGFFY